MKNSFNLKNKTKNMKKSLPETANCLTHLTNFFILTKIECTVKINYL